MKAPLFFLLLLLLILSPVTAVTITNSRYVSSLPAGSSDEFQMTLTPDTAAEDGLILTTSMEGDCGPWVRLDTPAVTLDPKGTAVTANIEVPGDATNGNTECFVTYTAPPVGMVQSRLQAPIRLTVTGGIEPTPTPEPTLTAAPTVEAQAPAPAPATASTPAPYEPNYAPILPALCGVLVLCVAFLIVMVFDLRRGRG